MYNDDYDQLIQAIYQGPNEEPLWQSFLTGLREMMQVQYVTLLLRPPRKGDSGVVLNAVLPYTESYDSYRSHYFSQDAFVDLPEGKAFTIDEVVNMDDFRQSEYFRDYLVTAEVEHLLGVDMLDANGYSARLRITRGKEGENFSADEKAFVERLVPHLKQAIALYSQLEHAQSRAQAYQDAFDQMDMGCFILDHNLAVLTRNEAAQQLLNEGSGLKVRERVLTVGNADESRRFKAMISEITDKQSDRFGEVCAFRVDNGQSVAGLGLLCRPLPSTQTPDAGPAIAIFISDPQKPRVNRQELLEQLFGLTAAEARLSLLLANGLSLDEAAEELGVTRNTAKSHLSASFSKTGVTRQPALVQLILRSVASIG